MNTRFGRLFWVAGLLSLVGLPAVGGTDRAAAGPRSVPGHRGIEARHSVVGVDGRRFENQCTGSHWILRDGGVARPFPGDPETLLDENSSSAVTLSATGAASLEIQHMGAPRWLSHLEVTCDASIVEIEVRNLEFKWVPSGRALPLAPGAPLRWAGPAKQITGLRLVFQSYPNQEWIRVEEVATWFDEPDPDATRVGPAAAGNNLHANWANRYPGAGNDLSECDDDVEDLADDLDGWDTWLHGDYNSWEEHFKRSDLGGTNSTHVDDADLAYFSGHGATDVDTDGATRRTLRFGDSANDDNDLTPGEAVGAWGNGDMEWMCFAACKTMEEVDDRDAWFGTMAGLHLILGFQTNMRDVDFGDDFGDYLVDDGVFDSAERIKTSWFDAAEATHGDGYTAFIIGENSDVGRDYLHGQGSVRPDPAHNNAYHWWSYSTCGGIFCKAEPRGTPSPLGFGSRVGSAGTGEFQLFPALAERGLPVVIRPGVLAQAAAATLPIYLVTPVTVDTPYVRMLANKICTQGDVLCGGQIGPGNPGHLNLIQGSTELRVCQEGGAMHYHDAANWLAWRTTRPSLLPSTSAVSTAEQILTSLGRRHSDAVVDRVDYLWQGARQVGAPTGGTDIQDSTFAVANRVVYRRRLGGRPVEGPGGSMTVTLGPGGVPQRIFEGAWRPATPGPSVNIIPVQDAINYLNLAGADATIDGIGPIVYQIQIDSWQLGYYEYSCRTHQTTIRPVYVFECTYLESPPGQSPPVTSQDRMCVWAEVLPPIPTIQRPADGSCAPPGSTICFNGSATGGVSPLTFRWRDDTFGQDLGSGASLCATLPTPPSGHAASDDFHTITLTVRDALGRETHDAVSICTDDLAQVTERGAGSGPRIDALLPNPTLGSVRVHLVVPVAGDYALEVFDVQGRRVRVTPQRTLETGRHTLTWDGRTDEGASAAAGIYYVKILGAGESAGRAVVVVR